MARRGTRRELGRLVSVAAMDVITGLTIWSITDERNPSDLNRFDESDFYLYFPDSEIRLFGVDLALERLQNERDVAASVGELRWV